MNRNELLETRARVWDQMKALLERSERAGSMSGEDAAAYDAAEAELDRLTKEIARLQALPGALPNSFDPRHALDGAAGGGDLRTARVLRPEQRMSEWADARGLVEARDEGLSLGKYVRGLHTGDWGGADAERRVMSEGVLADGGHLVPTPLSATVLDMARARARVLQAGAVTVPMTSATLKLPRQITDPSPAWTAENAATGETGATFDAVTFTARTLRCVIRASIELLEDSAVALESFIEVALAEAFALELDRAALRGSGTAPEPRGVRNSTGVTVTAFGGVNGAAPANHDLLVDAVQVVRGGNFEPNAVIYNPRTSTTMSKLKDTSNQPLAAPQVVADLDFLPTTTVPVNVAAGTSADTSEIYVGQWDQLMIGVRTTFGILPLRERYLADAGAFGFFAYLRADVQVARPAAFNVITGVRP